MHFHIDSIFSFNTNNTVELYCCLYVFSSCSSIFCIDTLRVKFTLPDLVFILFPQPVCVIIV